MNPFKLISYPSRLFIPMMASMHIPKCFASSIRHFSCWNDLSSKGKNVFFGFHLAYFNPVKHLFVFIVVNLIVNCKAIFIQAITFFKMYIYRINRQFPGVHALITLENFLSVKL